MSGVVAAKPARSTDRKPLSPVRILLRCYRKSRDNWKAKYQKLQPKLKRLQVRAHDACQSRDGWRGRAEAAERELQMHKSRAAAAEAAAVPAKKI